MADSVSISINRKEYWNLLEILDIADWVLTSHDVEKDGRKIKFQNIISKIHSYAEKIEMGEMIEYDEIDREYYPTKKFEDTSESQIFIQEFENESFWDGLTNRLVQREIEKLIIAKKIPEKVEIEEYFRISTPIEEIFTSEFEKNGLDNYELKSNIKSNIQKIYT